MALTLTVPNPNQTVPSLSMSLNTRLALSTSLVVILPISSVTKQIRTPYSGNAIQRMVTNPFDGSRDVRQMCTHSMGVGQAGLICIAPLVGFESKVFESKGDKGYSKVRVRGT